MKVELHHDAMAELEAAIDWYDDRRSGLGLEFELEIDAAMTASRNFRGHGPIGPAMTTSVSSGSIVFPTTCRITSMEIVRW